MEDTGERNSKGQKIDPKTKLLDRKVTRRNFGLGVAKLATTGGLITLGVRATDKPETVKAEDKTPDVTISSAPTDGNDENQTIHEEEVLKHYPPVFEEMFPYINDFPEEEKALRDTIKRYQIPQNQDGSIGIGTLVSNPTMGDLLNSKIKSPEGMEVKFDNILIAQAEKFGLNPNLIKAMVFIESHGRPDAYSEKSGAYGIAQFMPDTAMRYGLMDENGRDDRGDPHKSIIAMCNYMSDLKDLFDGNMGLATWAYHAGEGNVMTALREYFKANNGEDIGDYGEALSEDERSEIVSRSHELIRQNRLNVLKLVKHPRVISFIKSGIPQEGKPSLSDDTENYAIKAAAAGEYFEEYPDGRPPAKNF